VKEERIEQIMAMLLRGGVLLAAAVVLAGGTLYLWRHGREYPDYAIFHGVPDELKHPASIATGVVNGGGRALIQLGLLLLIATPVARVAFSVVAFARESDRTYVVITLILLTALIYSLFGGA
jgi:uncharacterized membrane protein